MSDDKGSRSELHKKIDELSEPEVDVVSRFVDAVSAPIYIESLPETWLAAVAWRAKFATLLQIHHALSSEHLGTTPFETAFSRACEDTGWRVDQAKSATQRFYDVTLSNGDDLPQRLSLKASAEKAIRPEAIKISKLTEAAWIQDARTQAHRRDAIVQLFQHYRAETSAIFMLRFLPNKDYRFFYELAEIPTSIFDQVDQLTVKQAGESTINLPPGASTRERDFAITIDRSDAKITLTGIRLDICIVHGRWGLK
jgi:hypothetical protein